MYWILVFYIKFCQAITRVLLYITKVIGNQNDYLLTYLCKKRGMNYNAIQAINREQE